MDKNEHVYCTECKFGEKLLIEIAKDRETETPEIRIDCDSYNPEDSVSFKYRPNYVALEENNTPDYVKAHKYCSNHKEQLLKDENCGCFHCLNIFDPLEIKEWIKDETGTAICPYCGIDSIIGESSGYEITMEFLKKMNKHWF